MRSILRRSPSPRLLPSTRKRRALRLMAARTALAIRNAAPPGRPCLARRIRSSSRRRPHSNDPELSALSARSVPAARQQSEQHVDDCQHNRPNEGRAKSADDKTRNHAAGQLQDEGVDDQEEYSQRQDSQRQGNDFQKQAQCGIQEPDHDRRNESGPYCGHVKAGNQSRHDQERDGIYNPVEEEAKHRQFLSHNVLRLPLPVRERPKGTTGTITTYFKAKAGLVLDLRRRFYRPWFQFHSPVFASSSSRVHPSCAVDVSLLFLPFAQCYPCPPSGRLHSNLPPNPLRLVRRSPTFPLS